MNTEQQERQKFIALRLLGTLTNRVLLAINEGKIPFEEDDEDNTVALKDFLKEGIEKLPNWLGGPSDGR
jgi:hypothetical protein